MIYAIDFDSTLCEPAYPSIGAPKQSIIDYCKQLRRDGHKLILWTCREGARLNEAVEWCNAQGLAFNAINANLPEQNELYGNDSRKIGYDFLIDDKNLFLKEVNKMADLVDSGTRRDFGTGAVRDVAEGKGRCDLLPLDILMSPHGGTQDEVFKSINDYIKTGDTENLHLAIAFFCRDSTEWDYSTMLLEVSKQFEDGARKYSDNNWRKGIPLHCYIDSALRHYIKYCRGDKDEPHDRAVCWNLLCAIWTHKNKPEMIDLPFKEE